jgi:hypothetical protein
MGRYNAKINSQGYVLEGAKVDNDGKTLLLSVSFEYPCTENQADLPYLKIIHNIPNK